MSVLNSRNFASFFETKMAITFEREICLGSSTTRCNPRKDPFKGVHNLHQLFYKNALKTRKNAKKRLFYEISYKFWNRAGGKERFFTGDTSSAPLLRIFFKNRSFLMTFQKKIIREIAQLADFLTFLAYFDHFWASISPKMRIRPQRFFEYE